MNPAILISVIFAETTKLHRRWSARGALILAAMIGLGIPVLYALVTNGPMEVSNNGEMVDMGGYRHATGVVEWALYARNFFVMRVMIVLLAAVSFAGEFQSRTLREDLLRPVPRWFVLVGKMAALIVFVVLSLVVTFGTSCVFGVVMYGVGEGWWPVVQGYVATGVTDVVFAELALCIAVLVRSVPMSIAGTVLFFVVDTAAWATLSFVYVVIEGLKEMNPNTQFNIPIWLEWVIGLRSWLPSNAFGAWTGYMESVGWDFRAFLVLGAIAAVTGAISVVTFQLVDVH